VSVAVQEPRLEVPASAQQLSELVDARSTAAKAQDQKHKLDVIKLLLYTLHMEANPKDELRECVDQSALTA
jgi:hypothetical protein